MVWWHNAICVALVCCIAAQVAHSWASHAVGWSWWLPWPPRLNPIVGPQRSTWTTWKQSWNMVNTAMYEEHQNSANFLGVGPGYVYCSQLRATLKYEPLTHYVVTACFEINPETWVKKVLDAGPEVDHM